MKTLFKLIDLNFGYNEILFSNLNLELNSEEITLLKGANGSGKTTLCRILSGLEIKYSGNILLDDVSLSNISAKDISQKIIYLKQEPVSNTVAATPDEDLSIWQGNLQKQLNEEDQIERSAALKKMQIPELLNSPFWEMSGGQIKRSAIAALLLNEPKYWILDEPASGLHLEIVENIIAILKNRKAKGFGTLIISHKIDQFKVIADRILKIENEKINEI